VPEAPEDADVETSSAGYARRFEGGVGRYFLDVQARATLDLLAPWPGARVLDVGGGHGQITGPLVDQGYDLTIYGSPGSTEDRVQTWTRQGRARFSTGDLLKTPFPDRAFDVVVSYRLLPHVRRWPELVAELSRLAARAVVVDYPTSRSVNAAAEAFFGLKKGVEGNTRPFTVFKDAEIAATFAASGFRVTGRRPQFLFPMALHRALRSAALARALEGAGALVGGTRAWGSPVILRLERAA
jgi:2-polyprenyl-3-methyl-5-hydroxy-6-metoxy-1,4-benzoquinol methylase